MFSQQENIIVAMKSFTFQQNGCLNNNKQKPVNTNYWKDVAHPEVSCTVGGSGNGITISNIVYIWQICAKTKKNVYFMPHNFYS